MSILLCGMEMPRSCADCPLRWVDEEYNNRCCITDKVVLGTIGRQDNTNCTDCDCPLVEIKTPHGRLGDLDELWDRMSKYTDNEGAKMPFGDNDFMIHRDSACELVEDAPTIIEKEV